MEIRKNDKRLCLHRIDVVIIAAVITILITVTAPSARWWAPPRALVWRRIYCLKYFGGHAALISRGTACTQGRQRITYCVGAMCGVAHKANHDPIYCISARQKSGDFTAIIEGGTAVGGTIDGVMASTGAAKMRTWATDSHDGQRSAVSKGGIFSDVCDHFPPSRHQSRITSEAQFEKGRNTSETPTLTVPNIRDRGFKRVPEGFRQRNIDAARRAATVQSIKWPNSSRLNAYYVTWLELKIWTDIFSLKAAQRNAAKCTAAPRHPFGADVAVETAQSFRKPWKDMDYIHFHPQTKFRKILLHPPSSFTI
ncbi:hypothetical protein C8J57DRAFT_1234429 [Mycena rebaudengoi]|nr:hypothetical protein C8J57DRAFT_1234429 [Mycena rebaudengoi]